MSENEINITKSYPWFNNELFESILRKEYNTNELKVTLLILKLALGKGVNFGSHIIRADVSYELMNDEHKKEQSFIIKTTYDPNIVGIFEKEITIYQKILPAIYQQLESIGDKTKLTPKCYHVDMERSFLVFEDLTKLGYTNSNALMGLNVEQSILVLKKVAKWHACNAMFLLENESISKIFTPTINEEHQFIIPNTAIALATVTQRNGHEELAKKIFKYSETAYDQSLQAMQSCPNDFNVICHGDLWSNNVMFTHDENGKPIDVIFLDFEFSFYASPMLDVINTLFASPHRDNSESDWDELVQLYCTELKSAMENFKYPKEIPSFVDLENVRKKRLYYGVPKAFLGLSFRNLGDQYDNTVIPKFMGSKPEDVAFREYAISNPKIKDDLESFIQYFDKNQCFN